MLSTTADKIAKQLRDEHKRLNNTIIINGEEFNKKELKAALDAGLCRFRQNWRVYSLNEENRPNLPLDKYYGTDNKIDWDRWHKDWDNKVAMAPSKWQYHVKHGAMIGDKFYDAFELEKVIRQELRKKEFAVSVLDVTVPYDILLELSKVWGTEDIVITNGTPTQIKFNVPKYRNVSTILASNFVR